MAVMQYCTYLRFVCTSRQENGQYRQFVANQAIRRNKLKKIVAFYLELASDIHIFAPEF